MSYERAIRTRSIVKVVFGVVLVALTLALFIAKFGTTRTVLMCCISSWVASFATYVFLRPRPRKPPVFKIHNPGKAPA